MQYFHFERLINKYSREITVILPSSDDYKNGEHIQGEPEEITLSAAIFNLTEKKIYNSNGVLTANDKQLIITGKLTTDIVGAKVVFDGKEYNIEDETENHEFTGCSSYILKYISAFDRGRVDD